jgi:polysaccharide export outer membrane protein
MKIVALRGFVTAAVLLISSAAFAFGQDLATAGNSPSLPPEPKFRKEYLVSPGDQLDIVVRRVPEATRSVVVRSDGQITLPLANDVAVAGLTTREIDAKLKGLLSQRLRDPEVTVIAAQSHPATVYVGGEVNAPGAVPLRNAATAVQAIALTGGLKRSASVKNIVIIRLGEDGKLETIPLDLKNHSQRGGYEALAVTRLTGDDIIFVPENGRSEVSRFIDDFINRPLQGVNSILGTYVNFRLVQIISRQVQ